MKNYEYGEIVTGKVTGIKNYGIFLLIDDTITGLIHISEITSNYVRDISDYVKIGETISCKVIGIDEEKKHLKLSIKDLNDSNNLKKNNSIMETKSGFSTLEFNLKRWIKLKEDELERQKN